MAKFLIGISGSVAAYKSVIYLRELSKQGHQCRVILTASGKQFVTPALLAGLGIAGFCDETLNLEHPRQALLHINLAKWADHFIIAPASANIIAKLANGIADNLLTTCALAYGNRPLILAPAMNREMWLNSITQDNLNKLIRHGNQLWQPAEGMQACGDNGIGRMQEPEQLLANSLVLLTKSRTLMGKTVLLTLGATLEKIDPVRYLSNHSSGKMGAAIIEQLLSGGAKVIALCGKVGITLPTHPNLTVLSVTSALEMLEMALDSAAECNAFIACAAVCDFRIETPNEDKIKKSPESNELMLRLIKNPDVVASVKNQFPDLFTIGFAAETTEVLTYAQAKLKSKNLDAIVANNVARGQIFNQSDTQITIIQKNGTCSEYPVENKLIAARRIVELLEKQLCGK